MNFGNFYRHKYFRKAIFITAGAAAGFGYYYFIGCSSGACPISSNPYISTIYGAAAGFILSINRKSKTDGINN